MHEIKQQSTHKRKQRAHSQDIRYFVIINLYIPLLYHHQWMTTFIFSFIATLLGIHRIVSKATWLDTSSWEKYKTCQAPVSLTVFPSQLNSMEISFRSHLHSKTVIATKICTWHDSCAIVACAKFFCDLMASNGIMARRSFHRIWIAAKKKTLVKRAPGPVSISDKRYYRKASLSGMIYFWLDDLQNIYEQSINQHPGF